GGDCLVREEIRRRRQAAGARSASHGGERGGMAVPLKGRKCCAPSLVVVARSGAARLPGGDELEPARMDCLRVAAVCGVERVDGTAGKVEGDDPGAVG